MLLSHVRRNMVFLDYNVKFLCFKRKTEYINTVYYLPPFQRILHASLKIKDAGDPQCCFRILILQYLKGNIDRFGRRTLQTLLTSLVGTIVFISWCFGMCRAESHIIFHDEQQGFLLAVVTEWNNLCSGWLFLFLKSMELTWIFLCCYSELLM